MRNQRQPGEVDEGLSQMTSALLTMLDTPEEAAAHQAGYDIDEEEEEERALTPRMGSRYSSRPASATSGRLPHHPEMTNQYSHHYQQPPSYLDTISNEHGNQAQERHTSWMPPWQGSNNANNLHENSQSMNVMPQTPPSSSPHHNSSHVGLYLP
jgi:translation initiation factor 4G